MRNGHFSLVELIALYKEREGVLQHNQDSICEQEASEEGSSGAFSQALIDCRPILNVLDHSRLAHQLWRSVPTTSYKWNSITLLIKVLNAIATLFTLQPRPYDGGSSCMGYTDSKRIT